jgi:type IV pilus assembly protein PilF
VRRGASIALAFALVLLAGCAAPVNPTPDVRTASDLTDNDRRARLRMELAAGYFSRGQTTTALDEVKQVIAARPDLPEAYNLRGLIYASMGQLALAEESFLRALQLNPRDADTMNNFGWFLCQQRRYDEAQRQFSSALAVPQYRDVPRTLLAKGVCEARAGRLPDAEVTLSKAYEMDPANPTAAFNLADVLFRLGELERARFYIRRVNAQNETANAQTLWLAIRIERKLGNLIGANGLGVQLRQRFPESPQALQFERGRFDD